MSEKPHAEWLALVGPREEPVDGVRDYCKFLTEALEKCGIRMEVMQVHWAEQGWVRGLLDLWTSARAWKDRWIVLQYTPLSWSRRGFPFGAVAVLATLRLCHVRTAVMFHDWTGYTGPRALDRIRWACQRWAMHRMASLAERSVFPVPPQKVSWLRRASDHACFVPIGANLASPTITEAGGSNSVGYRREDRKGLIVAVYSLTGGEPGIKEAMTVAAAIKTALSRVPAIRLVVLGRGSKENQSILERALNGAGVELAVRGLLPAEEVAWELSRADVVLFVRGEMLGHRGSAIAGIACGAPVVGYGDPDRAFPLSEGGVVLVPLGDGDGLANALTRVLIDDKLRLELGEQSRRAQSEYFSWDRIAARFAEALSDD